jgi:phosphate-selective porin OprO and OprP
MIEASKNFCNDGDKGKGNPGVDEPKFKLTTVAAAVTAALLAAAQLSMAQEAPDGERRLQELEDQMKAISQELESVKSQLQIEQKKSAQPDPNSKATGVGLTGRLADGLVVEDPHGNWRLRLTGRALLDYRTFSPDDLVADTFSVRQARLGVHLGFLKNYSIYVEGEYSGSSAILSNAYLDAGWWAAARFRFGQFKPMFGLEQTDRVPYFDFTERGFTGSLTQNFLFDRGIMVYGIPRKGIVYGLSLTNGSGQNQDERQANVAEVQQDGKDLTGRVAANFAELFAIPDSILQAGMSFKTGEQSNSTANPYAAASIITEGRGLTFFTPAAFNAAAGNVSAIDRQLIGAEAIVARGPVKFQSEYMKAAYRGTSYAPAPVDFDRGLTAWYASLTWLISGERYADAYKDGMIGRIMPRNDFSAGGATGAWELGFRYSAFDGSDFNDGNPVNSGRLSATAPVTTSTNKADAYTVGLKWLPNAYVRFLFDYIHTDFDTLIISAGKTTSHEDAVNFRAQVDFF